VGILAGESTGEMKLPGFAAKDAAVSQT